VEPARSHKEKLVLDTSLFVNPEVRVDFGKTPTEALENFLSLASQIPKLEFYMPSSTFQELLNFIDTNKISPNLYTIIQQKPPSKYELSCPALFFYEFVDEMRDRVNKGLRIAEKAVRGAASADERSIIQSLRQNYREALRDGIIDSKEDIDLVLLAKELDALLVSVDNGVVVWAEKLGIKWLMPSKFRDYLLTCIKNSQHGTKKAKTAI
jgi:RNA ligase partner protein